MGLLDRLDAIAGNGLERAVSAHHSRRLRRLGRVDLDRMIRVDNETVDYQTLSGESSPDGLWVADAPAPRDGSLLEVLIDGERALPKMQEAIQRARSHVHLAGWHLSPDFRLDRSDGSPTLRDLLAETAERVDVRVLLWAGPPVPAFQPTRSAMKKVQQILTSGTKVRCRLDSRERTMHCHHEKTLIVDDEIAFVGGIDMSSLAGDRWDRRRHQPRGSTGWHDVATMLRGPVVADVAGHFRERWQEVAQEKLPEPVPPAPAGTHRTQLLRTVPEKTYKFAPRGEFSILDAYLRALRSARRLIYVENQFLWSSEITEVLADKLRRPPSDDFRMVLVLPARPSNGKDTTRGQLGRLLDAAGDSGRIVACTVQAHDGDRSDSIYVHAKVGIVDDRWLTIGSANLNEHSLFNDTEMNVLTIDEELARQTRISLWSEHLEMPESDLTGDPTALVDRHWRPIAEEQLHRSSSGLPPTARLMRLPAVSRRAARLVGPMRGLLVDG